MRQLIACIQRARRGQDHRVQARSGQAHSGQAVCLVLALAAGLCLTTLPCPAMAEPLPSLRAAPNDQVDPGDPTWPLGRSGSSGVQVVIAADEKQAAPNGLPSFRVELTPGPKHAGPSAGPGAPQAMRTCLGLFSATRRNLSTTRAIEFTIKASPAVNGILVITSSNTEQPKARDRFFGSFSLGQDWKTLRLSYGSLAPLPGWPAEAQRLGFSPGDLVLRPDSVEDICIGAEASRIGAEPVTLWISGVRFVR